MTKGNSSSSEACHRDVLRGKKFVSKWRGTRRARLDANPPNDEVGREQLIRGRGRHPTWTTEGARVERKFSNSLRAFMELGQAKVHRKACNRRGTVCCKTLAKGT